MLKVATQMALLVLLKGDGYSVTMNAMKKILVAAIMLLTSAAMVHADSYVPADSRVTQIASSQLFIQNAVIYKLDKGTTDCAAGSNIYYYSNNVDNLKAMYATVLAAYMAGAPIITHFPTTGSCISDGIAVGAY